MVAVRVYVEGGGDTKAQAAPLREAVAMWIGRAVPEAKARPKIIACGGRRQAFEEFSHAVRQHDDAFCILLVDSEDQVNAPTRWEHVRQRKDDNWAPPPGTADDNLHFMAPTMEAWLCSDAPALASWFGEGFKAEALPKRTDLEAEPKADLNAKLERATTGSKRGAYRKGRDLGLLGEVSPGKVQGRCELAGVFVGVLRAKLG